MKMLNREQPVNSETYHKRIAEVEATLVIHSELHNEHKENINSLKSSIHENTELTRRIADNTSEIVDLFKGAKLVKKLIIFSAPVVAGLGVIAGGIWAAIKIFLR